MSRRGQSYFSQVKRRLDAPVPGSSRTNTRTPLAKPRDEPGVLWAAFREDQEQA